MLKLFICENESCSQFEVEFILTDPMAITTCGGCGQILPAQEVDND